MKINILLCDTFSDILPCVGINNYQSMFFDLFNKVSSEKIDYSVYEVFDMKFPDQIYKEELYLITGSSASAYDNTPWIKQLILFIKRVHIMQVPLVGVCFGHQIIAQALGGKVAKSEKGWGTGIRRSNIVDSVAQPYFPDGVMQLYYNHHDQVIELPNEAKLFATSDFCPNEGFIIRNNILTFQGHPEYTTEYNRQLIIVHADKEDPAVRMNALASFKTMNAMGENAARWMLDLLKEQI